MTKFLSDHLFAESDLTEEQHQRICDLLVLAFPRYADLFRTVSYYYAQPDHRLWYEEADGTIIAHLDFEHRTIAVNGVDVDIAGVGEVAVHPDRHKQGLGRKLMALLQTMLKQQFQVDYGFLQCRDEVVGFYQSVGWHKINQTVHEVDIKTGKTVATNGNALIMPIHKSVDDWDTNGDVDLRGLPW